MNVQASAPAHCRVCARSVQAVPLNPRTASSGGKSVWRCTGCQAFIAHKDVTSAAYVAAHRRSDAARGEAEVTGLAKLTARLDHALAGVGEDLEKLGVALDLKKSTYSPGDSGLAERLEDLLAGADRLVKATAASVTASNAALHLQIRGVELMLRGGSELVH